MMRIAMSMGRARQVHDPFAKAALVLQPGRQRWRVRVADSATGPVLVLNFAIQTFQVGA